MSSLFAAEAGWRRAGQATGATDLLHGLQPELQRCCTCWRISRGEQLTAAPHALLGRDPLAWAGQRMEKPHLAAAVAAHQLQRPQTWNIEGFDDCLRAAVRLQLLHPLSVACSRCVHCPSCVMVHWVWRATKLNRKACPAFRNVAQLLLGAGRGAQLSAHLISTTSLATSSLPARNQL